MWRHVPATFLILNLSPRLNGVVSKGKTQGMVANIAPTGQTTFSQIQNSINTFSEVDSKGPKQSFASSITFQDWSSNALLIKTDFYLFLQIQKAIIINKFFI